MTDDTRNRPGGQRPILRFLRRMLGTNELSTLRSDIATGLADGISTRLAEEMHRNAAHLDAHLTQRIDARINELQARIEGSQTQVSSLHARIDDVHAQASEFRSQIDDLQAHNTRFMTDLHTQNTRSMTDLHAQNTRSMADLHAQNTRVMVDLHAQSMRFMAEEVHRHMSHVDSHLSAHLAKELALQLGSHPRGEAPAGDPRLVQQRLRHLGRLMEPASALGVGKRRIGHEGDGGYVMLDDFEKARFALSLGVGAEMTWDVDMAERGIEVHQFDYTIEAPPATHERIRFHRSRIAPVAAGTDHSFASAQALGGNQPCIIKMDIEGDEWAVLDAAGPGDFDRVPQLVCELHDFDRVADTAWYERAERVLQALSKTFRAVHVHANNNGLLQVRGNVAFPEILEVTFANRNFYEFGPCTEVFPTALDAPNREDLPDIVLGAFRF